MLILDEIAFFRGRRLEIRLHQDLSYSLRWGDLVEYRNHRRRVRGRTLPYVFRSVEQLRYDFEEDIKRAEAG